MATTQQPASGTQPAAQASGTEAAPGTEGAPNPAEVAAAAARAQEAQPAADEANDEAPWSDPAKAEKEILRLRKEAGDARILAKKNAAEEARTTLVKDLMGVLDPSSQEPPSAEALLAKVQASDTSKTEAQVEAALVRAAWDAGIDPQRLEYLQFRVAKREDFGALDTSAEGWRDSLKTMVTDEVAKDQTLKATGARKGTGDGQYGGAGSQPTITKEAFSAMSMRERTDLYINDRATYDRLVNP